MKKMKKWMILLLVVFVAFPVGFALAEEDENDDMEEDAKMACEAVLCLSSGQRPDECGPSLERYFSIKKKEWKDTVKARKKFLKKCPESENTGDPEMDSLVNAIGEGAGFCNATELNKRGKWVISNKTVDDSYCSDGSRNINTGNYIETYDLINWGGGNENAEQTECRRTIRYWVVDQTFPSYCTTYQNHSYTDGISFSGLRLIRGNQPWETRWVD